MEANRHSSLQALSISQSHLSSNPPNLQLALKFAKKSVNLYESKLGNEVLKNVQVMIENERMEREERERSGGGGGSGGDGKGKERANTTTRDTTDTSQSSGNGNEGLRNRSSNRGVPSSSSYSSNKPNGTTSSTSTSSTTRPTSSSTSTSPPPTSSSPPHPRSFTQSQQNLINSILKYKINQFYHILQLDKDCGEEEIKKAYKKLALATHPDKNGAPGADEAFKMVGKAFSVLSDPQKRSIFDRSGDDPDSRFSPSSTAGPSSSFGGAAGGGGGGMGGFRMAEEVSPEEIFNMFFGGPMGGGGFGGGSPFGGGGRGNGGFTTFYGPGGVRFQSFGGGPRRRTSAATAGGASNSSSNSGTPSTLLQLLPLIVLILFSVLSSLPSLLSGEFWTEPEPSYSFEPTKFHSLGRITNSGLKVPYWINPKQFSNSQAWQDLVKVNEGIEPFGWKKMEERFMKGSQDWKDEMFKRLMEVASWSPQSSSSSSGGEKGNNKNENSPVRTSSSSSPMPNPLSFRIPNTLSKFERSIESEYLSRLQSRCRREIEDRQDRINVARGFLGIGANWDEIKRLTEMKLESCQRLRGFGYEIRY